jgi:hypothetical protein
MYVKEPIIENKSFNYYNSVVIINTYTTYWKKYLATRIHYDHMTEKRSITNFKPIIKSKL